MSLKRKLKEKKRLRGKIYRHLPLVAHYGQEPQREIARTRFYDRCAEVFEWDGWEMSGLERDYDALAIARMKLPAGAEIGHGERGREIAAIQRDRTIAINLKSAPFEWLSSKGLLETKADHAGIGNIRFSAGMQFRDLLIGAEPMGLKSANLEGGSGGGGVPIIINDFKMDCIYSIGGIKADMLKQQPKRWGRLKVVTGITKEGKPKKAWIAEQYGNDRPVLFDLLHRLIYLDEWLFTDLPRRKHKAVMEQIHNGLDQVAVYLGLLTPREYDARWRPPSSRGDARRSPPARP